MQPGNLQPHALSHIEQKKNSVAYMQAAVTIDTDYRLQRSGVNGQQEDRQR